MCGIIGVVELGSGREPVRPEILRRMRDALAHRGPDGAGLWISPDGRLGLGHRRLAIIDPSAAAAQPMSNEDGRVQIVFNGEIYNHAELRPELERAGHRFVTDHSDTEVLVHGYEQWGDALLPRLRGMFAFALFDARRRSLWLVRDRLGIKPLYYTEAGGRLLFGSEIKALLEDPAVACRLDEESLFHYLSFLTAPAPRTLFAGISKLPAGCSLLVPLDGPVPEPERWWDPWDHVDPLVGVPTAEIAERVLATLRDSVRYRKVSDVPVGVFLSGGIDSSTNVALFAEGERSPVRTYSIGYAGDPRSYRNELDAAERVARVFGAAHHERRLDAEDFVAFLPQMIHHQDEPLGDPVCVPLYYVSALARADGTIVCQVGEGADELFFGYPRWQRNRAAQQLASLPWPRGLTRLAASAITRTRYRDHLYAEWLRRSGAGEPLFWSGSEAFGHETKLRLLSERLRRRFAETTSYQAVLPIRRRYEEKAWEKAPLQWMTYVDLNLRLPELLLMRVDKMSMAVGVEARIPFLDHKLVELALSIPESVKAGGGELKSVLRKAVRGLVPDFVLERPKQGFGVPLADWLRAQLGRRVRDELSSFCRASGLLDERAVLELLESSDSHGVFPLLNLALWWRRTFGDGLGLAGTHAVAVGAAP